MSEQSREEREQLVADLDAETEVVSVNRDNAEHERWLETGQTEPDYTIPSEDEDEADEEEADEDE
jgi:hypothetical protein